MRPCRGRVCGARNLRLQARFDLLTICLPFTTRAADEMKRSSNRILTTHVGSLIRPAQPLDFFRAKQSGEAYDKAAYAQCLKDSVAAVVGEQAEVGVDVV